MSPDAALIACRFLHDAPAMLVFGASAYLAGPVPRDLACMTRQHLRFIEIAAAVMALAAILAALPVQVAIIGDGWPDALDPATTKSVLMDTDVGHAWLVQAAAAIVLVAAVTFVPGKRPVATAVASGLFLASLALTGHAVLPGGTLGLAHQINDAVHVLAAGAWFGGLVALCPILVALGEPRWRSDAGAALRRFSQIGHVAVALVLVSGVVNTYLILGAWPANWDSLYQVLLLTKIMLALCMIGLALFNRYSLVPRLSEGTGTLRAIRAGSILEIVLGIGIIALVSAFGTFAPAP